MPPPADLPPPGAAGPVRTLLATARGPARVTAHLPPGRGRPKALVVLLHGAGSDTAAPPLPMLADLLAAAGIAAVRFDQPYATAVGRRPPDRGPLLDAVLLDAMPELRRYAAKGAPAALIGRSSGARVACRVAAAAGAVAVVCLGFPLSPPGRSPAAPGAREPRQDRAAELAGAGEAVPVLVLQGARDPFGRPVPGPGLLIEVHDRVAHTPDAAMAARAAEWVAERLIGSARKRGSGNSAALTPVSVSDTTAPDGGTSDEHSTPGERGAPGP